VPEHGADGAVDVADGELGAHRLAALERGCGDPDQLVVERPVEPVVLAAGVPEVLTGELLADVGDVEDRREVEPGRLPVVDRRRDVEGADLPDRLVEGAEAQLRQELADLLGDVLEERDHELRLAAEAAPQDGVLGGHADRTGVEVADAHHDAAADDQGGGREAVLLGPQQGRDHHVAAGLQLAVGLHHDPVAQAVDQQGLLGLGQAELPGAAGVLERGQRGRAGAAVVPGDQHHVGVRLGHARCDRADPDLGDQLHVDAGRGVGVLEVVDELGEVLDGVDVVVRRRADQAHTGRRVPGLGHPRVDLRPR
jgi:hypothetical protein